MSHWRVAVDFSEAGLSAPQRSALNYDVIVVVGEHAELYERHKMYRELGVESHLYPLSPRDSPTVFSLLGITGLILSRVEEGARILVEGYGGQWLIEAALRVVADGEVCSSDSSILSRLQSPLHLRSVIVLEALLLGGLDLRAESKRHVDYAFTGGDAHVSDIIEHTVDLSWSLDRILGTSLLRWCPLSVYRYYRGGRKPSGACGELAEAVERLDKNNTGSAKVAVLVDAADSILLVLGCKLMNVYDCVDEMGAGIESIREVLSKRFSLSVDDFEVLDPEEAACISYGEAYGYGCL